MVNELKVMRSIPNSKHLVTVLKHERLNKMPISWKRDDDKVCCYLTETEMLDQSYEEYLYKWNMWKLSGSSKLRILLKVMKDICSGMIRLHGDLRVHGDLSIWNVMFRKSDQMIGIDYPLYDAVIIDLNETRPFVRLFKVWYNRVLASVCM